MTKTNESVLSDVLHLYETDYAASRPYPREYTLFNESLNDYVTYLIPRKVTPEDLDDALRLYAQTCGDKIEFKHDNIKISRWKNSLQGAGALKLW